MSFVAFQVSRAASSWTMSDEFSMDATQTAQLTRLLDSLAATGVQVLVTSRTLPSPSLISNVIETHFAAEPDIRNYVAHALHADDSMVDILDNQLEADVSNTVVDNIPPLRLIARSCCGLVAVDDLDNKPALRLFDSRLEALYPENHRITGLHITAAFGLTQLVDSLLSRGHRIDATDNRFDTPLYKACVTNSTESAVFLLDRGAYPDT